MLPVILADDGQFAALFGEPSGSTPLFSPKRLRKLPIICGDTEEQLRYA
jgi:hypothetical protein